jgi:predicted metal-dependent hydrolase
MIEIKQMSDTTTTWPPPYNLRRSPRARRTFLQITPASGLEIVIPDRLIRLNIEKLLNEKRNWIEKMLTRFRVPFLNSQPLADIHVNTTPIQKPNTLDFQALNKTWKIFYEPTASKRITVRTQHFPENIFILKGNIHDTLLCFKTLKKLVIKEANINLIPWLKTLSIQTGLKYDRVIIRGQSTLWGSCNAKKTISLNYKLLFLPKTLAEHVLLHELCHLKYLNHSEKFWGFLKSFDAQVIENKKALKIAECYMPAWLTKGCISTTI